MKNLQILCLSLRRLLQYIKLLLTLLPTDGILLYIMTWVATCVTLAAFAKFYMRICVVISRNPFMYNDIFFSYSGRN